MVMPGIGETLREARTAAGIQLDDAERTSRIRIRYLDALENEEWDVLPGDAYVRGFLHTYADFLGLDARGRVRPPGGSGTGGALDGRAIRATTHDGRWQPDHAPHRLGRDLRGGCPCGPLHRARDH